MGIKDFVKVFTPTKQVNIKEIATEDLAVDAFLELFSASSMQHAAKLTNPAGEPTTHLTVALSNAVKRKALGADDIWCWDSRDPRKSDDPKQKTLADRAAIRKTNQEEIKKLDTEITKLKDLATKVDRKRLLQIDPTYDGSLKTKEAMLNVLKARNPGAQHFSNMVRDVQFILTKLGVRMAFAPVGCDGEKLAAQLCLENICDGVITKDTDAIAYGAPKQYKKVKGKPGIYDVIIAADCLKQHKITYHQLVEVCTVLGCDDADKTPGVGPATAVKRVREGSLTFTAEQKAAQIKFEDRTPVRYEYIENTCTNATLDELSEWLIKMQGFKTDRVEKALKPFYTKK